MDTIFLKDYQPCAFKIVTTNLTFAIESTNKVTVINCMHMQRQGAGPLILNGDELLLKEIRLNDQQLSADSYQLTSDSLEISDIPSEFCLTIVTEIHPEKNTKLMGLYASRGMLCTQCEAEGFRRMTYFLDRPDVMSRFTTKIIANKQQFPYLLSNGNLIAEGDIDNELHYCIWEDPFLKPAYLFALVAGQFAIVSDVFVTMSGKEIDLMIFVEPGDESYCQYAMQAIKHAMRWDEERFGREYDLNRFMIVAVKDFNMGAMENKGLNIFNAKYVLADTSVATDADILGIESVVGHEYFHNWTGNRVTCRDWFQLSLKEGLTVYRDQEFSSDMNDRVTQRIEDVTNLRKVQFIEDSGAMAHPVQPKSYQEISNFYTATVYEKGAEIVRMYEVILGKDGFRKGMNLYFTRHDGQAVRIEDFLQAMSDANKCNLSQFLQWYHQIGTPIVTVSEHWQDGKLHIKMQQSCSPPLLIPIRFAVYERNGAKLANVPQVIMLQEATAEFIYNCPTPDVLVNYLQGFSAPIILQRELPDQYILDLMACERDGFALWDLKQNFIIKTIIKSYKQETVLPLNTALASILRSWFTQPEFGCQFLAELFKFPSIQECMLGLTEVDPVKLHLIRETVIKQLALSCQGQFLDNFIVAGSDSSRAARAFRNVCLQNIMLSDPEVFSVHCLECFNKANNMTDCVAAFTAIMQTTNDALKDEVCQKFYQEWSHNELVMDKWFYLQATQNGDDIIDKVKKLTKHKKFSWSNPNKVRMLIGGFSQNTLAFHQADGSGYNFLKECILHLDTINPQVAARLCAPFTRWQSFDKSRQQQMKNILQSLSKCQLSKDVSEIINKSIKG